ncbi:MAG TPA: hypothetical protein VLJ37_04655 [bacterium]|nr:hypothetical protein [bacterium]
MRRILSCLFVLLAFAPFMGGCGSSTGGTETGNTTAVSIRVIGYQSSLLAALTVGDLQVGKAMIVLDRLHFRPFSACQDGSQDEGAQDIQFNGPFVVDLLNAGEISGLEGLQIPTGRYCRIELVLKKLESTGPMFNKSVQIEGARSDGTPFLMTTEVDEEFKLENESTGFLIEEADPLSVFFIAFDLDQWFNGVDLMDTFIEVSSGGGGEPIILINDIKNQTVQELIEENIKHSADLFEDSDDNDSLDPEEEGNPLAIGTSVP